MDTVFIYGRRMDSTSEIEVLDSKGAIVQSIDPRAYIMSDQLIKLPLLHQFQEILLMLT
jgi:hypothetical protein